MVRDLNVESPPMKSPILVSVAVLICMLGTPFAADAAKKTKKQAELEAKQAEAEAKKAEAEAKKADAEAKRAEADAKKAEAEAAAAEEEAKPAKAEKKKSKPKPKAKSGKGKKGAAEEESDDVEVEIEDATDEELAEGDEVEEVKLEESAPKPTESEDDEESSDALLNWLSFTIQQDALFFGTQPDVCGTTDATTGAFVPGPDVYSCHGPNGVYNGPLYSEVGNEVQGGVGIATFRLMIGYDRLFIHRLLLGGRVGYAFGGEPSVPRSDGFMPFHVELKAQYYFGEAPFARDGIRPFAAAAVGLAEVDSSVNVDYYVDQAGFDRGEIGSFQVWRKAGTGFGALSGGAAYPLGPGTIHAELRLLIMLGSSATGMALGLGYNYGL
jgi:hypothetical protein